MGGAAGPASHARAETGENKPLRRLLEPAPTLGGLIAMALRSLAGKGRAWSKATDGFREDFMQSLEFDALSLTTLHRYTDQATRAQKNANREYRFALAQQRTRSRG
jgi:hypothetical protein